MRPKFMRILGLLLVGLLSVPLVGALGATGTAGPILHVYVMNSQNHISTTSHPPSLSPEPASKTSLHGFQNTTYTQGTMTLFVSKGFGKIITFFTDHSSLGTTS